MNSSSLNLTNVRKQFDRTVAVSDVSLQISAGELLAIIGRSGCGKSTLLRIMAGLVPATGGTVELNGRPVTSPPENLTVVFQEYGRSLLPWKTVVANVAFGLSAAGFEKKERVDRALASLDAVGLRKYADFYPWQLSGGMQQRVALARGLVRESGVLLLDEPFGSVDAQSRLELQDELLRLWSRFRMTIVIVTHDIDEAVYLGDRVCVMSGTPGTITAEMPIGLDRPRDQVDTRGKPQFSSLRRELYEALAGGKF
jgi:NitT/TauT family transport system ATP-binding protein